ncbi:MAG: hypothetical protein ACK46X_14810 [Candidatus Sericytochromatia bacterium]
MASEAVFLLWVLATLVVALVVIRREPSFRWLWGWHLQMAIVLALCALGLTVGPAGPFAFAAWAVFLAVTVGPALLLRKLSPIVLVDGDPERAAPTQRGPLTFLHTHDEPTPCTRSSRTSPAPACPPPCPPAG